MLVCRWRMLLIRSQNWARDSGSTPVVGSWINAQHSPSFCFIPPESFPAGRSRNGASPVLFSSSAIRASRSALSWPNSRAKKSTFSYTDSVWYRFFPSPCGIQAMRGQTSRRCFGSRISPPSTITLPCSMTRAPEMSDSRLDFPTPSGPISPTIQRAGISSVILFSATVFP